MRLSIFAQCTLLAVDVSVKQPDKHLDMPKDFNVMEKMVYPTDNDLLCFFDSGIQLFYLSVDRWIKLFVWSS